MGNSATIGSLNILINGDARDIQRAGADAKQTLGELRVAAQENLGVTAKEFYSLNRQAKQAFEETRTPAEQYIATLERLNKMTAIGVMNQDTYTRAVKQAKEAMEQAGKAGEGFGSSVSHIAGDVIGITSVAGAAVMAAATLKDMAKEQLEVAEHAALVGDALGVSAGKMLQMSDAFYVITGQSGEQLDSMLERLSGRLGEMSDGGMPKISAAFRRMHVDVDALLAMKPDKQFEQIVDVLHNMQNAQDRNAASSEIFGRSYIELLPIIERGTSDFNELGVSIAGATDEAEAQARTAQKAGEDWRRMGADLGVLGDKLVEIDDKYDLDDRAKRAQEETAKLVQQTKDLAKAKREIWANTAGSAEAEARAAEAEKEVAKQTSQAAIAAREQAAAVKDAQAEMKKTADEAKRIQESATSGLANANFASTDYGQHLASQGFSSSQIDDIRKLTEEQQHGVISYDEMEKTVQQLYDTVAKTTGLKDAQNSTRQLAETQRQAAEEAKRLHEELERLKAGALSAAEMFPGADPKTLAEIQATTTAIEQQRAAAERAKKDAEDTKELARKADDDFARRQDQQAAAAKRVWEETRTAAEKYAEELKDIQILLDKNKIDQETFARRKKQLDDDLAGDNSRAKNRGVSNDNSQRDIWRTGDFYIPADVMGGGGKGDSAKLDKINEGSQKTVAQLEKSNLLLAQMVQVHGHGQTDQFQVVSI